MQHIDISQPKLYNFSRYGQVDKPDYKTFEFTQQSVNFCNT